MRKFLASKIFPQFLATFIFASFPHHDIHMYKNGSEINFTPIFIHVYIMMGKTGKNKSSQKLWKDFTS